MDSDANTLPDGWRISPYWSLMPPCDWRTEFTFPEAVLERLDGVRAESSERDMGMETPAKILAVFKEHPEYSLAEVAAVIGKSRSAVERAAAKLVKSGKLRHVGPSKGGHWKILK